MKPEQKLLVQESFAKVVPISALAADLFYGRLFELDPSLKPLFKGDMKEQGQKLMMMIRTAVDGLDDLDKLVPVVQDMGRRHATYGVENSHYDTVGASLLWTLEQGLGPAFTPEVKEAWTVVYTLLAHTMKEAVEEAAEHP
ncbi:MAG: globin family protein [Gloeobacterales cyanobacterium]